MLANFRQYKRILRKKPTCWLVELRKSGKQGLAKQTRERPSRECGFEANPPALLRELEDPQVSVLAATLGGLCNPYHVVQAMDVPTVPLKGGLGSTRFVRHQHMCVSSTVSKWNKDPSCRTRFSAATRMALHFEPILNKRIDEINVERAGAHQSPIPRTNVACFKTFFNF